MNFMLVAKVSPKVELEGQFRKDAYRHAYIASGGSMAGSNQGFVKSDVELI